MSKKVSIIVMTYMRYDMLSKNFQSIKNQDYNNIEVILHDDGSPNFDREYIESLADKIGLEIKIGINPTNLGTVKNYNAALKEASGEIIVPLSSDDVFVDSTVISTIVEAFERTGCDACSARMIGEVTGQIRPSDYDAEILKSKNQEELLSRHFFGGFMFGAVFYFKKDFLERQGFFDERYRLMEDYPFFIKCALNNIPIEFIDKVLLIHGEDGVSRQQGLVPPKLYNDQKIIHDTTIMPNLDKVKNKRIKRRIQFAYLLLYDKEGSSIKRYLKFFGYVDIIILTVIAKIKVRLTKDYSAEYQFIKGK